MPQITIKTDSGVLTITKDDFTIEDNMNALKHHIVYSNHIKQEVVTEESFEETELHFYKTIALILGNGVTVENLLRLPLAEKDILSNILTLALGGKIEDESKKKKNL